MSLNVVVCHKSAQFEEFNICIACDIEKCQSSWISKSEEVGNGFLKILLLGKKWNVIFVWHKYIMQLGACNLVVSIAVLCNLNLLTEFLNCYVKVE